MTSLALAPQLHLPRYQVCARRDGRRQRCSGPYKLQVVFTSCTSNWLATRGASEPRAWDTGYTTWTPLPSDLPPSSCYAKKLPHLTTAYHASPHLSPSVSMSRLGRRRGGCRTREGQYEREGRATSVCPCVRKPGKGALTHWQFLLL